MAAKHDEVVALVRRKKKNRDLEELRGVYREYRRYRGKIWDRRRQAMTCLGSFRTAEEAARAYDAAAVRLHGAASAITNFRQRTVSVAATDADASPLLRVSGVNKDATAESFSGHDAGSAKKKMREAARPEARSVFRGVHRRLSGRYAAQIGHSKGRARKWLGLFDTAEDAARAYDAAGVELHGAKAITNFTQPPPTAAVAAAADESPMDLSNSPELLAVNLFSDSIVPGAQLEHLFTDLP